jgi:HSP20 family protein
MKETDVDVSLTGDRLTIKGEKRAEAEIKEDSYYRSERSYGSFSRSIDLPADADQDKITAQYEDGILEISVAKKESVKPKKVNVSPKKKESKS